MSIDRREFLKLAGLTGLGLGVSGAGLSLRSKVNASQYGPTHEGLEGKRWAMVIDVRKFKTEDDYKRIISACHTIHNIPDKLIGNKMHEVKWLWTDEYEHTFPGQHNEYMSEAIKHMTFPLMCNHCDNPPCVRVCPTKATYKRKDGLVAQDYHRCIGCRFCMAACPYGSRSFNWFDPRPYITKTSPEFPTRMIGVVEKCNFCVERLAKGLKPNCVENSNGAMVFGDLKDPNSEVRAVLKKSINIQRKPELGTQPNVFYVIGGGDHD